MTARETDTPQHDTKDREPSDRETRATLHLNLIPGLGPKTLRRLIEHFGSAQTATQATVGQLRAVEGIGPKLASQMIRALEQIDVEAEIHAISQGGSHLLRQGTEEYPPRLDEILDPPPLLYVKGSVEPIDQSAIAIVGARRCTPYGLRMAERLASSLARVGLTVISGLARGIDGVAHTAAIKNGGRTLAVMANGLAQVYPPEHELLAESVIKHGALLSEMPMGHEPLATLFPRRNRIIAGLCLGVVVVEATPRSGSLSTARHALEQGREVFAVPGPADSLASQGCHRLIRDGATLVETVEDILEPLRHLLKVGRGTKDVSEQPAKAGPEVKLGPKEAVIYHALSQEPQAVDQISVQVGMPSHQVLATLSLLELRHLVRRCPGQMYSRS